MADGSTFTVHQRDRVNGYTIAVIEPERVTLTRPGGNAQVLALVEAIDIGATTARRAESAPSEMANTQLAADGINTDQSIPENVVFGPTGTLPEGMKQVGH